jgi:hypothetical protein
MTYSGPEGDSDLTARDLDAPGGTVSPSSITPLASAQLTAVDVLTIEVVETSEHPTMVIIRWPDKPSVIDPRRFADAPATIAQLFARAHVVLAAIRADRKRG